MPCRCLLDRRCLLPAEGADIGIKPKFEILTDYQCTEVDRYEAFLRKNDIQVAGIESIQDASGHTYTYDVNTNTNYNSDAEAAAGDTACWNWHATSAESCSKT